MLYAAFGMILVGVLCFLYVSLSPKSQKNDQNTKRSRPDQRDFAGSGYSSAYRRTPPSTVSPQLDERIRREREIADRRPAWEEPSLSYARSPEPKPSVVEKATILQETGEGLSEILPPEPAKIVQFEMDGILYFDHSGKIPFGSKDLGDSDTSEEDLRNFKRVGSAILKEEDGKFVFYSGNASYTYQSQDLEQVVFYDQGFVFLLKDGKAAKPVYFTNHLDQFKDFLTQATTI
ncbi:hypothetical protein LPTSP3_g07240 [Leptospira kobayashii]|uniref:Lipoprotein n=1 Tax=Leptospira kobayashii TaxID=1917830 RepID=A0ABN6KA38_9LEPT|nr:hypothetical protein [Leptospira kobayashii]BDA77794.1 hypothetical protein LPTSP3_g07240 [Leptospira kobayashii]